MERGSGWLLFASIMLIFTGIMRIFDAFWAFGYNGPVLDGLSEALYGKDLDTYGWIWLIAGVILILAGFAVLGRVQWARWVGVFAAFVAMISSVSWLPVQPIWAMLYILLAAMVIYALIAHGERQPA